MKVLVTGREGQLARSLAERAKLHPSLTLVSVGRPQLDLEQPETIVSTINAAAPDLVINAAAYTAVDAAEDEPDRAFRINGAAAGQVASAARSVGAAVIQISTDYVFDGLSDSPYPEDAATNPQSIYGSSKLEGEHSVREANPDHAIVRTGWVYSPWGHNFVRTMMIAAETRDSVAVVADQRGNPSSALDLADGLLALARQWPGAGGTDRTYHLAGTGEASWADLANASFAECARIKQRSAMVHGIAMADWPARAVRPRSSTLDCVRFEDEFGFRMPAWRVSLPAVVRRIAEERVR